MKNTDWKAKAEEFLKQYADPDSDLLHEEAIVYFLSQKVNCDEAVDKKFELWKARKEEHGWLIPQTRDTNYIASMWRLIELGEIGQLSDFWDPTKHTYWLKDGFVLRAFKDRNYFAPLFLFRSDIALNGIDVNLYVILFNLQEFFKNGIGDYNCSETFQKSSNRFVPPLEQIECIIAASYIFGQFRLNTPIVDPKAMSSATKFLLDNQDSDGKWYDAGEGLKGWEVLITASVVHALALAKPNGVERVLRRSYKWLLEQQNSDGSWSNVEKRSPVYSTVFVLDALELANGGSRVTFKMSDASTIDSRVPDMTPPIIAIQSGVSRPKKKTKNKSKKDVESDNNKEPVIWKDHQKAVFVLDRQNKIKFIFSDNDSIELGFERLHHPPELLKCFCDYPECSSERIQKYLETNDSANHRVTECNKHIGRELEKKGFHDCPKGFQFIEKVERRGFYRSRIPVYSIDKYDRMQIESEMDDTVDDRKFKRQEDD